MDRAVVGTQTNRIIAGAKTPFTTSIFVEKYAYKTKHGN